MRGAGFEMVRLVVIDEDWSRLRFRRLDYIKPSAETPTAHRERTDVSASNARQQLSAAGLAVIRPLHTHGTVHGPACLRAGQLPLRVPPSRASRSRKAGPAR
jgi:hypothetical protein